jgi:signal peptidase I
MEHNLTKYSAQPPTRLKRTRFKLAVSMAICLSLIYAIKDLIYFNPSNSLTPGYYFTYPSTHYTKGDIIVLCIKQKYQLQLLHKLGLPYADSCPYHSPYLLKRIIATTGDMVDIHAPGIRVNGVLYPKTKPVKVSHGIYLPVINYSHVQLAKDQFIVLGNMANSYDSRYFGVVDKAQIKRKAWLIWPRKTPL